MLISTKGTNAIRALVDIVKHQDECEYIPLSAIATRLNVSRKYLECIMCLLAKNKMVCVCKGKFGGYRLCKSPEEYSLFDILIITEEEFKTSPCHCVDKNGQCKEKSSCTVLNTCNELHQLICNYLKNKTLKDLL